MLDSLTGVEVIVVRPNGVKVRGAPTGAAGGRKMAPVGSRLRLVGIWNMNTMPHASSSFVKVQGLEGKPFWVGGTAGQGADPKYSLQFVDAAPAGAEAAPRKQPGPPEPPTVAVESPSRLAVVLDRAQEIRMEFARVPTGRFRMGRENGYPDEIPLREVTITKDFWMQTTEVTQGQWEALMETQPSYFKGADRPVEHVSWNDGQEYIRMLNERCGNRLSGRRFALPTEAEWEYACRAGSEGEWYFGDDASKLGEYAWYYIGSGDKTHPVGVKKPNAWGLHDMHGSVWEWCADWYGLYAADSVRDPAGPESGKARVLRGGSWDYFLKSTPSAYRYSMYPDKRMFYTGLRLVLRGSD